MEANKILNADILDLIFEDRNKDYGAYDLRKTYNKRILKDSLLLLLSLYWHCLVLFWQRLLKRATRMLFSTK
jgi:protein TonB